jgi:hypothetical protein
MVYSVTASVDIPHVEDGLLGTVNERKLHKKRIDEGDASLLSLSVADCAI